MLDTHAPDETVTNDHGNIELYCRTLVSALFVMAENMVQEAARASGRSAVQFARDHGDQNLPEMLAAIVWPHALRLAAKRSSQESALSIPMDIAQQMREEIATLVESSQAEQDIEIADDVYDALQEALNRSILKQLFQLSKETRQTMHARLTGDARRFIDGCAVRAMGEVWDANDATYIGGTHQDLRNDIAIFQHIERKLTEWRSNLDNLTTQESAASRAKTTREAIDQFAQQGGHISQLTKDQIMALHTRGLITMVVHRLSQDEEVVVGTVSSLLGAPTEETDLFSALSVRTLALDAQSVQEWVRKAAHTLVLCRSSIIPQISSECLGAQQGAASAKRLFDGLSLHQLGLAAAGKLPHMRTGQACDMQDLLFRIGRLKDVQLHTSAFNKPSTQHNAGWADPLADSTQKDAIGQTLHMCWKWFQGSVQYAITELTRDYGILQGKGWNMTNILQQADRIASKRYMQWKAGSQI